jgi:hypothetical protein
VLSLAVASAQTYPQGETPRRSTSGTRSVANRAPSAVTVTGCVMQRNTSSWILSNATMSNAAKGAVSSIDPKASSRSGSPSNEGTSAGNRNGTAGAGVSGSTSTAIGTSGEHTNAASSIDSEAHGGGVGATDQAGSTVGAGAAVSVAGGSTNESTAGTGRQSTSGTYGATGTSGSAPAATSYQLTGITSASEYSGKRVEITGMITSARTSRSTTAMPMLRVTSVRVLAETCQ